MEKSWTEIKLG